MIKQFAIFSLILILISCQSSTINNKDKFSIEKTRVGKKYFSQSQEKLDYYNLKAKEEFESGNEEQGLRYLRDSVKNLIVGSYIEQYKFKRLDGTTFDVNKSDKPIFLQVTATWCPPCKAEIPALNAIVEKYADSVDFVLLFRDTEEKLEEFSKQYNKRINVIPSPKKLRRGLLEISGFRHELGFPFNYLISKERYIHNFKGGAFAPDNKRTMKDVYSLNYKKLENEILDLLKGSKTVYN